MSGLSSNSVNLGPGITTPVSGKTYSLNSLAFSHWLDNSASLTSDGNPILAWQQDTPVALNQEESDFSFSYIDIHKRIKAYKTIAVGVSDLPKRRRRDCVHAAISQHY